MKEASVGTRPISLSQDVKREDLVLSCIKVILSLM